MTQEALKLALEALEDTVNGCICRNCINQVEVITAIKEALAQPEPFKPDWNTEAVLVEEMQRMAKRIEELEVLAQPEQLVAHREAFWCVDLTCKKCYGADFRFKHKSSVDKKSLTTPAQPEERNFCPRCGKRLASGFVEISIHTCTPPQENT